jgi:uncharacterized protein (TIGR03437 family)
VIQSGGVQNAASNIALTSIAPQVLVAIKGQNLSTSTELANGYPLPTTLGGATVTFSGAAGPLVAPLFYASPTQINAQVPNGITGTTVVVTTAAGVSAPYTIPVVSQSYAQPIGPLGIFSQDETGCGQAVAFNIPSDGRPMTLNTPQNSLDPDNDLGLAIFLTGLGGLEFSDRQNGLPWTFNNSDNLATQLVSSGAGEISATLGAPGLTATTGGLSATYLGPAPGKVGVDQANVLGQWKGAPQGCRVPLSLAVLAPQLAGAGYIPFTSTQLVDISVQPGGGVCADPPASDSGLGIVAWQKSTVSDAGGPSSAETVTAQFIQSEGLGFPQPGPLWTGAYGPVAVQPPACNASLPSTLNAGALTLSGPGFGPIPMASSTQDARVTYQANLPDGTLQGGAYQVTGTGGSQVGAFGARFSIPPPIVIDTTNLQPGTKLETPCQPSYGFGPAPSSPCGGYYSFTWTGGDDRSIVTVQFTVANSFQEVVSDSGASGEIAFSEFYTAPPGACPAFPGIVHCTLIPDGDVEVIITQTPADAPSQSFNAAGLAWGGQGTWKYTWDFRGLSN